jgi:hypothetical protein
MRNRALPLLAALAALTLSACHSDPDSTPPPSTPPTTPPTTPTSSTPPKPPPPNIPPAATAGLTVTSAEAFARFYLAALDHLVATGDGSLLRRWSDKGCTACSALLSTYEATYRNGGSVTGDFRTRIVRVKETRLIRHDTAAVLIKATEGRQLWVKKAGEKPTVLTGGPVTLDTTLSANGGHWMMYELVMK